jgi:hypothetical protein
MPFNGSSRNSIRRRSTSVSTFIAHPRLLIQLMGRTVQTHCALALGSLKTGRLGPDSLVDYDRSNFVRRSIPRSATPPPPPHRSKWNMVRTWWKYAHDVYTPQMSLSLSQVVGRPGGRTGKRLTSSTPGRVSKHSCRRQIDYP